MIQYIDYPCPNCQRELKIREQYVGRRISCKSCGKKFRFYPNGEPPKQPTPTDLDPPLTIQFATPAAPETASEADHGQLAAQLENLQHQLAQAQVHEREAAVLRKDLETIRGEWDKTAHRIQTLEEQSSHVESLEKELAESGAQVQRLQAELKRRDLLLSEWEAEREAIHAQWQQKHEIHLSDTGERLRQEQVRAEEEVRGVEARLGDELRKSQEAAEAARRDADRLRNDLEASAQQNRALTQERDRLAAHHQELHQATGATTQQLQSQLDTLTKALEAAKSARDQALQDAADAAQRDRESASRREKTLTDMLEKHKAELETHKKTSPGLKRQLEDLQRELTTAKEEASGLREGARQALEQESSAGAEKHQATLQELERLQKQLAREQQAARAEIDGLRQKAETFQQSFHEMAKLAPTLDESRAKEAASARRVDELVVEVQALQAEMDRLRQAEREDQLQLLNLHKELDTTRTAAAAERKRLTLALAEEQARKVADDFASTQGDPMTDAHSALEAARRELDQLRRERDAGLERVAALTQHSEQLSAHRDELANWVGKNQLQLTMARKELESVRAEASAEKERLNTALAQEQAKNATNNHVGDHESRASEAYFANQEVQMEIDRLRTELDSCRQALSNMGIHL